MVLDADSIGPPSPLLARVSMNTSAAKDEAERAMRGEIAVRATLH